MAAHFIIFAWKIPWREEPDGLSPWGCKESDMTVHAHKNSDDADSKNNLIFDKCLLCPHT